MWISRVKYEVEKLKYQQRISYLENLICPCESHDYKEIDYEIIDEHNTVNIFWDVKTVARKDMN